MLTGCWMKDLALFLVPMTLGGGCLSLTATGCAPNSEVLERTFNTTIKEVVKPVATKAIAELATRSGTVQGGLQGINPGYQVQVEGIFGTCFKGDFEVRVVGVAGQLMGSAQADSDKPGVQPLPVPSQ